MRRVTFPLLGLVLGLGMFTAASYLVITRTTREWFESDLALRGRLAMQAAETSLLDGMHRDPKALREVLTSIARDGRIVAAAACTMQGQMIAATAFYPTRDLPCRDLHQRVHGARSEDPRFWSAISDLPSGPVHVSAGVLRDGEHDLARIVLLHDLTYLAAREQESRSFLLYSFLILSMMAAGASLVAARLAWKGWTRQLRNALTGEPPREFQPLLRDVRSLAEQLASEREREARGGVWSPERLRSALIEHLHGERVVVLANREPYIHQLEANGAIRVQHPASGLVTAIEPVMRACSGVWVAHGSGTADRQTVDAHDRVRVPPGEESYALRRVWLSDEEEQGYYYGFSNEGLWPLCHLAHTRPIFRSEDYTHYEKVNRRFAEAVCSEVDTDDPIVLVQDYHFALAPRMIRERLPRATIITFWHIPWPNAERIGICPWREELISGLLGSSILGFHTQQHCNNFIDSVDAFMESRIDREARAIVQQGRRTLVRPYPISIEWPVHWLKSVPDVQDARAEVRRELGLPQDALLGVGVDRLDYTKGLEERLAAVDTLLARHPEFRGKFTFVQLAAPSRVKIVRYRELNERLEKLAEEINARWSTGSYQPIVLLRAHHEPSAVFRFYRACDVCYVSSLHDGMNLVAKEFVAARDDERGVLLLSQFTGAARDLTEALIVNPYDLEQASDGLAAALRMSPAEQRARMRSMRRMVSEFNVYRWAGRMLIDAAELRRKERMLGRFGDSTLVAKLRT